MFDLSEFQSIFFYPTNIRVIGKIKDKFKRIPINKFIKIKNVLYCF